MSRYTLKCGCVHGWEPERIVKMCPEHYAEWRTVHDQAMADYRLMHPLVTESAI